ncbi:hypothetical protein COMNV_00719 [Commensalibacter sp. Nvir]|uniref:hypothetical protein n=1 Tax=Commensalibacter sp. Nvir TaxID=3069817 RepID=UPI002D56E807|nr:hypothetical protein COMNV_00719 [Commensalibacter sp. Nvir]
MDNGLFSFINGTFLKDDPIENGDDFTIKNTPCDALYRYSSVLKALYKIANIQKKMRADSTALLSVTKWE